MIVLTIPENVFNSQLTNTFLNSTFMSQIVIVPYDSICQGYPSTSSREMSRVNSKLVITALTKAI